MTTQNRQKSNAKKIIYTLLCLIKILSKKLAFKYYGNNVKAAQTYFVMEHACMLLNIHYPLSLEYGKQSLVDVPLVVTKLTVDHISLELNQPKSEADQ